MVEMEALPYIFLLACACFVYGADGRKSKWCCFKVGQSSALTEVSYHIVVL